MHVKRKVNLKIRLSSLKRGVFLRWEHLAALKTIVLFWVTITLFTLEVTGPVALAELPWFCDKQRFEAVQLWLNETFEQDLQTKARAYNLRTENYCEGVDSLLASRGGDRQFDIVSLTQGKVSFTENDQSIPVRSTLGVSKQIRVRITSIHRLDFYRLDGLIPMDGEIRWNLSDIIHSVGLTDEMLGLTGFFGDDDVTYVPVTVPMVQQNDSAANDLLIAVKPRLPVQDLKWRWVQYNGWLCGQAISKFEAASNIKGLTDIVRVFKAKLNSVKKPFSCLEVRGRGLAADEIFSERFLIAIPD
jgi:hypothetical protein